MLSEWGGIVMFRFLLDFLSRLSDVGRCVVRLFFLRIVVRIVVDIPARILFDRGLSSSVVLSTVGVGFAGM